MPEASFQLLLTNVRAPHRPAREVAASPGHFALAIWLMQIGRSDTTNTSRDYVLTLGRRHKRVNYHLVMLIDQNMDEETGI